MGGRVNVTIRLDEQTVYSAARWTNSMPFWVRDMKFIRGERAHLQEYANVKPGFGPAPNCPDGYGLVVFDLVHKRLLSMQCYTGFVQIVPSRHEPDEDERKNWNELLAEKRLKLLTYIRGLDDTRTETEAEEPLEGTYDEVFGKIEDLRKDLLRREDNGEIKYGHHTLILDIAPWVIEDFEEDPEGAEAMKARMIDLGFVFSEEDKAGWDAWIKNKNEMEIIR